jgi:hypothetical protein
MKNKTITKAEKEKAIAQEKQLVESLQRLACACVKRVEQFHVMGRLRKETSLGAKGQKLKKPKKVLCDSNGTSVPFTYEEKLEFQAQALCFILEYIQSDKEEHKDKSFFAIFRYGCNKVRSLIYICVKEKTYCTRLQAQVEQVESSLYNNAYYAEEGQQSESSAFMAIEENEEINELRKDKDIEQELNSIFSCAKGYKSSVEKQKQFILDCLQGKMEIKLGDRRKLEKEDRVKAKQFFVLLHKVRALQKERVKTQSKQNFQKTEKCELIKKPLVTLEIDKKSVKRETREKVQTQFSSLVGLNNAVGTLARIYAKTLAIKDAEDCKALAQAMQKL